MSHTIHLTRSGNCPHCSEPFDLDEQPREEATVGSVTGLPHVICLKCRNCIGCSGEPSALSQKGSLIQISGGQRQD